jgi:hypothetical protein
MAIICKFKIKWIYIAMKSIEIFMQKLHGKVCIEELPVYSSCYFAH